VWGVRPGSTPLCRRARTEDDRPVNDSTVRIRLDIESTGDSVTGQASDGNGATRTFAGWLGLVESIDRLLPHSPSGRVMPGGDERDIRDSQGEATMTTAASARVAPIELQHDDGEALWCLGALATIKASSETTDGRVAIIEHLAPRGAASPLHVHRREDQWVYVIDGELTFWVDGAVITAPAGAFVYKPCDVAHAFEVTTDVARFLLVAEPAGVEGFMRAIGEPARSRTIPPAAAAPPPDPDRLTTLAAAYGIEILGPPANPTGEAS
jgi:quercetin dioxygenase-like cupin family protein